MLASIPGLVPNGIICTVAFQADTIQTNNVSPQYMITNEGRLPPKGTPLLVHGMEDASFPPVLPAIHLRYVYHLCIKYSPGNKVCGFQCFA